MTTIINTVLPVFGMIMLGLAFAKFKLMDAAATRGLTLFVFNAAIPALLFKTVSTMAPAEAAPWTLWIVYFGGLAMVWLLAALISRFVPSLAVNGGAAASMATGFGNLGLLGTPLALAHFGNAVAVPLGLILSIHAPILWFTATLHRELARHSGEFSVLATARELFSNLARNAIILALLAAAVWRFFNLGLHPVADRMLQMLADASVPTALFALGLSLSTYSLRGQWTGAVVLIILKMCVMPVVVFGIGYYLISLPKLWLQIAVLFAAMPTGANAFLFASRNNEAVAPVSAAIAVGTGLAAFTVTLLLYVFDHAMI
jgi:malonate transporter and related proteins